MIVKLIWLEDSKHGWTYIKSCKIDKEAIFELIYEIFIAQEQELLKKLPVTTDSVFGKEVIYRDFSFDQLKK